MFQKIGCIWSLVPGRPEWPGVQIIAAEWKEEPVAVGTLGRMHVIKALEAILSVYIYYIVTFSDYTRGLD
jgi:hypothetical protein